MGSPCPLIRAVSYAPTRSARPVASSPFATSTTPDSVTTTVSSDPAPPPRVPSPPPPPLPAHLQPRQLPHRHRRLPSEQDARDPVLARFDHVARVEGVADLEALG